MYRRTVDMLRMFSSVIIWGLRTETDHTHRHIHRHLFTVLRKIDFEVVWCDDIVENNDLIKSGSLVIAYDQACKHIRFKKENYYALLNTTGKLSESVDCKNYLKLRVYGEVPMEPGSCIWDTCVAFNAQEHMLYQPWTTNLLPEEFLSPVFNQSNTCHWIGSIWNDEKSQGNIENIRELQNALKKHNIVFVHHQNISDEENMVKIRESRLAPAIGGEIQVARDMLPCRIWKNISYGQLGVTNLQKSLDVFGADVICSRDISELIDRALSVGEKAYKNITSFQQKIVSENYTYLNWFYNVGRAFSELCA